MVELTGGLNLDKDPIYITDKQSPNLSMIRFHKGLVKKLFGFDNFGDLPNPEFCMGFHNYVKYNGTKYLICCGNNNAYKWLPDSETPGASSWVQISPATTNSWNGSTQAFVGTIDALSISITFDNLFITTNGIDVVQKFDGSFWDKLGGTVTAKFLTTFYSRLILGATTEGGEFKPGRIRWSILGNPEVWTGTGSGAIDLVDEGDSITGLCILGDKLFIFKENSIWEMYYVGGVDIFRVRKIVDNVGTLSPKTIVNVGEAIAFYGVDDIYLFDGNQAVPVGLNVRSILFTGEEKIIDGIYLNRAHAIYDTDTRNYIVALPTTEVTEPDYEGIPNLLIYYDVPLKAYSRRTLVSTCLGFYSDFTAGIPWAYAQGTWEDVRWDKAWRIYIISSGIPTILYGKNLGVVNIDNRTTKSDELLTWESKDIILAHGSRFIEFRYLTKGDPFDISYSYDSGLTWTGEITLTPSQSELEEVIDYVNTTKFKVRVRIRTYNQNFELAWIEPWTIPRTRSVGKVTEAEPPT